MGTSDRFLASIVLAIVVLAVVAFAVVMRQQEAEYRGARTPEDAAHDYLLALQRRDFERAYEIVSPDIGARPESLSAFVDDVSDLGWDFGLHEASAGFDVRGSRPSGDEVEVEVVRTVFVDSGLLDSSQFVESFHLRMGEEPDGAWRITGGERFVHRCWTNPEECRLAPAAPVETGGTAP